MLAPNPNSLILPNPQSLTNAPPAPKKVPPKAPASASPLASSLTASPDAQVAALYQPLISQMNSQAQQQITGGDQAIQQYAASLANAMSGVNYAQPYNAAISDQAAIDSALAQFAQGAGSSTASALQADLQAGKVDPSAVAAAVNAVNAGASGTAGLAGGLGSAELGQLVTDRAAGQEYGLQIPQIAKLNALQDLGKFNTSIETNLENNINSLESNIPKDELSAQQAAATIANDQAKLGIEQQNANTSAEKAAISAQSASSLNTYRTALVKLKQQGQITDTQYKQAMTTLKAQAQASTNAYHQGELSIAQQKADEAAGKLQARTVNGNVFLFNPATGTFYEPGTGATVDPNSIPAKPKALTSSETMKMRAGISLAKNGYYALVGTGGARALPSPASTADLQKAATAAGMTLAQFKASPKAQAAAGIVAVHANDNGSQDPEINKVYLELIDQFGLSRQQAFSAVGQQFPGWAKRNQKSFFPKGNASAPTGASYKGALTPGLRGTGAQYITYRAAQLGVDPQAVLGVTTNEGLSGGVGDGGTSFGPFQMHIGGALPASIAARGAAYAQQWAWSTAGIDYALGQIARVAKGLKGKQAVNAIVTGFERPANPAGDEQAGYSFV